MKYKDWITSIIVVLFIVSSAILVTIFFKPLFWWQLQTLDTVSLVNLTQQQVIGQYDVLLHYLVNPFVSELVLPLFKMSNSGAFHFYEVKQLFILVEVLWVVSGIGTVFSYRYMRKQIRWHVFKQVMQWLLVVPITIVIVLLMSFEFWFVAFHRVFFNNNDWLFNPITDNIILVLPESFFLSCFVVAFCIIQLFLSVCWWHCKSKMEQCVVRM